MAKIKATELKVRITTTAPMLGMSPPTEELYRKFISITEKKLGVRKAIEENKKEEEIKALRLERDQEVLNNRGFTVFPIDEATGKRFFWDYQIRGFLKDVFKALLETDDPEMCKGLCPLNKYNVAKRVDQIMFVQPRRILIDIPEGTSITLCERSLRKPDPHNHEQDASVIASSEKIEAGAKMEIRFLILNKAYINYVKKALAYGLLRGFGQWRNSGMGTFMTEFLSETEVMIELEELALSNTHRK